MQTCVARRARQAVLVSMARASGLSVHLYPEISGVSS